MTSSKTWVIFDEENILNETKIKPTLDSGTVRRSLPIRTDKLEYQSSPSEDLRAIFFSSQDLERWKYSVFDSLRRREVAGDYLGWSKEVRGEARTEGSDVISRHQHPTKYQ